MVKKLIVNFMRHWLTLQQRLAFHVIKWAGPDLIGPPAFPSSEYVPADSRITPMLLNAAFIDGFGTETRQAELNACMESLRDCQNIMDAAQRMLGELAVHYGVEEALVRVAANQVLLGMNIARRLAQ
jgi:hypothetical protein